MPNARSLPSDLLDALRIYFRSISAVVRSQLQYRASSAMLAFGNLMANAIEFFAIWALFDRFSHLQGWTLPEVALLYGMVNMAFALAEIIGRGFDVFPGMVKSGGFDRILLRPRSNALLIAASAFEIKHMGRFLQGACILAWAVATLDISWTAARIALMAASILSGACIFIGLFVLQATAAFWTIESLEIANTVTYGGVETAQYPLSIYRPWFRRFFIFVVPLACVNYFPALVILDHPDPLGFPTWLSWFSPILGALFLAVTLQVWKFGVRHYRSTGS